MYQSSEIPFYARKRSFIIKVHQSKTFIIQWSRNSVLREFELSSFSPVDNLKLEGVGGPGWALEDIIALRHKEHLKQGCKSSLLKLLGIKKFNEFCLGVKVVIS